MVELSSTYCLLFCPAMCLLHCYKPHTQKTCPYPERHFIVYKRKPYVNYYSLSQYKPYFKCQTSKIKS